MIGWNLLSLLERSTRSNPSTDRQSHSWAPYLNKQWGLWPVQSRAQGWEESFTNRGTLGNDFGLTLLYRMKAPVAGAEKALGLPGLEKPLVAYICVPA